MRTGTTPRTTPADPRPAGLERRQVHAVAACYFVASFAALGLPPYLTAILPGLGDSKGSWAGLLYIMPTVFSALGAPLWGRLADRFGRKRLLLRAQLGLSVSFLLAGAANSLWAFALALVLQGFLGGTFAATNGYLAAALEGPRLSRALTLMQGSARASLVAAPILVGALSPWVSPHRQYLLMAVLPLAAAALLTRLPEPKAPADQRGRQPSAPAPEPAAVSLRPLYVYEFAFVFATIISFPYLIALVDQRLPGVSATVTGLLFALPHLCYLLCASRVHNAFLHRPHTGLALGFALVALGLAGHGPAHSLLAFALARLVLGAGLTLGLVCLSVLAAEAARGRAPGRMFGTLELISKGGAVAAGLVAALVNAAYGAAAPVLVGTAAALVTALAATAPRLFAHSRWSR
ncbi:MFS transporter [Kitasatospora mediocidica]|uniref:MFS transporter n=1 Tax=Kitasatospora mediocidica TaxID=58352 RepID=UPI0005657836|nr:MFS transporter [Kitasatospora mediocidica]